MLPLAPAPTMAFGRACACALRAAGKPLATVSSTLTNRVCHTRDAEGDASCATRSAASGDRDAQRGGAERRSGGGAAADGAAADGAARRTADRDEPGPTGRPRREAGNSARGTPNTPALAAVRSLGATLTGSFCSAVSARCSGCSGTGRGGDGGERQRTGGGGIGGRISDNGTST